MTPSTARFDDAVAGDSFELSGCRRQIVARTTADVIPAIAAAAEAARRGRWVAGFVAYEAASGLDPTLAVRPPDDRLPLVWFGVFDDCVRPAPPIVGVASAAVELRDRRDAHRAAVAEIRARIAAGWVYQVNLTARARVVTEDPAGLYASLLRGQPSAHSTLLVTPSHVIASASPELFFSVHGRAIVTRPMKGTAARGRWPAEDRARARGLRGSAKERAENVMIVDLVRNDLGRVAEYGTVHVPRLLEQERYPTVWQLTSTVTATLRPDAGLVEVFRALFPSGSVTGAPKWSAMQTIHDLEGTSRGVYCGAIGWIAPGQPPRARFSVGIRTVCVDRESGVGEYGTGGGITWSSTPGLEWRELVAKTAVLDAVPDVAALFETVRADEQGVMVNRDRHLDRLAASAAYFGFRFDRALVPTSAPPCSRVKIMVDRGGRTTVESTPLIKVPTTVRLGWAGERVDSAAATLSHKTTDRTLFERVRAARPDVDDVILVNERGEVTETTVANLAVRTRGRWWTPALACGVLPGVERGRLIETGVLAERVLAVADVVAADELAVVSSLRGWRAAHLVD